MLGGEAGDAAIHPGKPSLWESEHATGDLGGLRTSLSDRGVVFNFTYAADAFGVVSGGIQRGVLYNGLLDLGTDVDLETLVGWTGAHFHLNALYPHGENGSANYVGDIGTFSNLEAYDTYRLYELWVEQDLFDDRVSLRAGQITFDSEFAVLDSYGGLFVHSGLGPPTALAANLSLPAYPNATPGIRVKIEPGPGFYIQAALFDGNVAPGLTPDPSSDAADSTEFNRHGTHWALRREEGALWAGEVGYQINQPAEDGEASPTRTTTDSPIHATSTVAERRGLAGSYKVGFVYHTDDFAGTYDTALTDIGSSLAPSESRNRGANYAIYANLEQEIWQEPGSETDGLGIFGHAVWMPRDRNFIDFSFEGGLHYQGPIPGRGEDAIGLGIAFLHISDEVRNAVQKSNRADGTALRRPDFEATLELTYRYQASPWLSIQPHAQYVIQPGGTGDLDNALILGIRTNIAF